MANPFSKEMGTYLETRNKGAGTKLTYHLGFKRRVQRAYKKTVAFIVHISEKFWRLFFPKPEIKEDMTSHDVHVFDRERAPVGEFVRKVLTKKEKTVQEKPEDLEVDLELVEKTIREGKV